LARQGRGRGTLELAELARHLVRQAIGTSGGAWAINAASCSAAPKQSMLRRSVALQEQVIAKALCDPGLR